jgi:hypothetical protein
MGAHKAIYPRRSQIERAIAAAKAGGIKVGGVEIDPDGTIRILGEQPGGAESAYDRWKAKRERA